MADPLASSSFAGAPAEGYQPPPPPCPPDLTPDDLPTLPLHPRDTMELYLPDAAFVARWGIDYEVWPPHRTDGLTITPDFDESRDLPARTRQTRCPTTLEAAELSVDSAVDDVIHLRVAATSETDAERHAEVFYPQGSRTLVVRTANVAPASDLRGEWYAVLQPLWGTARVSVQRLTPGSSDLTVPHVPVGPVVLHLVRTTVLEAGPAEGTLMAPAGFSELWPHLVSQWYAATPASLDQDETITPTVVIGRGDRWQRLGLLLPQPFDPARPNTLVTLAHVNEPRTVSLPCGVASTLRVLGVGRARLQLGASTWTASPETPTTFTPTCASGANHVDATLTGSSGRSIESFVLLVGGAP